jgi:anti-sigma factor RsiW
VDLMCRDVVDLLLDYLEGALDADTRATLQCHFDDCAPCLTYLRTYDRSRRLVGSVARGDTPEPLPELVVERLRQLLRRRLQSERS